MQKLNRISKLLVKTIKIEYNMTCQRVSLIPSAY